VALIYNSFWFGQDKKVMDMTHDVLEAIENSNIKFPKSHQGNYTQKKKVILTYFSI
jgi:hypothetical protein